MEYFFLLIFGYLLGSISGAIIISRFLKLPDPRASGSKNPGATNVLRLGNKQAAAATLIFDILKGTVAVSIANWLIGNSLGMCLAGISVFIGHLFPIYYAFKGGKGVAVALSILCVLSPVLAIIGLCTWLMIAGLTRYSSLAAIITAPCITFISMFFNASEITWLLCSISTLLLFKHRTNIHQLRLGTEPKIKLRK